MVEDLVGCVGAPREGEDVVTMRRQVSPTLIWGLVLLTASGLMLLLRLDVLPTAAAVWTVIFAAVGGGFGYAFVTDRRRWWAAIPAGALLGLAAVTAWTEVAGRDDAAGGALFLGTVALGFWAVRARDRRQWWAIVPAGATTTLALVAGLSAMATSRTADMAVGAVFFLGLAATFALVALTSGGARPWAYAPAAVLAAIGVVAGLEAVAGLPVTDYLAPAALAVTGLVVLWRSMPHHHGRT